MSYTYAQKKKGVNTNANAESSVSSGKESSIPNSAQIAEIEHSSHQVDMPTVMREKMEGAFGMDLSSVKLYENKAVGDAGAEAVTKGSSITFAPGKLNFSSTKGQELLGHEMSHVASQARGEVHGSGFLNDSALEAKADTEGFKAARGESVASGALSNASAVSAAGPMQAKSGKKKSSGGKKGNWFTNLFKKAPKVENDDDDNESGLGDIYVSDDPIKFDEEE